nr:MAG TPA: hypothetical protein [Caudoviricetes sp.]
MWKIRFCDMFDCRLTFLLNACYHNKWSDTQNDRKKELFFTPRSCGVSFCPGYISPRGFSV